MITRLERKMSVLSIRIEEYQFNDTQFHISYIFNLLLFITDLFNNNTLLIIDL